MAKKTTPIITHTEIINRAIHSVKMEIADWHTKCECLPQPQKDEMLEYSTKDLRSKLDALKEMYRFETGTEYT